MNWNRSQYSNRNNQPLTLDEIGVRAPSALAVAPHESRSSRFAYVPTMDIVRGMMAQGFQPFTASQSLSRIEGKENFTKHMIRFRYQGTPQNLTVGDSIPEIVLVNAHDGTSAYKLIAGLYRLICSNGLMVSDSMISSVSIPHFGNITEKVIEGSYRIVADSERALEGVRQWSQLQLTSGEQNAFAESAHTLRFADSYGEVKTPITPAQLLQPRRTADSGSDLWRVMNRVQENVIRGGLRGRVLARVDESGNYIPGRRRLDARGQGDRSGRPAEPVAVAARRGDGEAEERRDDHRSGIRSKRASARLRVRPSLKRPSLYQRQEN